jgi:SAM-dependent methyltransferase
MSDHRALSHGALSSNKGERGITKRLAAVGRLTVLSGDRLLDIGCADGTYTKRMRPGFGEVHAIDIEPERLAVFTERGLDGVVLHDMSADDLSFPDGEFDVVTAIEVVEHVADLPATYAEVARVLKPRGRFCVTTPNRWFPFETHGPLIGGRRRTPLAAPGLPWLSPLHRRWSDARAFTRAELNALGAAAGLRVVGHEYMWPPFDQHPVGRRLRWLTDRLERGPLAWLGMAHVIVYEKE